MRLSYCDHHIISFLRLFADSMKPLDLALSHYLRDHKSIGAHDRRTIGETLYGMVRWKSMIDHFCPSPDPKERLFCFRKMAEWQKDPTIPEPARLGVNEFLYGRFYAIFGAEKTRSLCHILNGTAPTTIRANLLKTTREDLIRIFEGKFEVAPCEQAPAGLQFKKRSPLFALPEFKEGLFEMQDEGSQLIANLVQCKPGEHVLDYCSGSGGKTLAFAPAMQGKGQIYLHDIRPWVLQEASKRLKRAGIQNAQTLIPGHPQLAAIRGKVNWVLADVPCTGTGTLRRNPDAKWKIDAAMVERLVLEQREIVKQAVEFLKPGGRLVYATCSLLPEENQEQTTYFLKHHPLALEGEPLSLLPKEGGMDGFYSALFRKI
ncbi:MAG TPA: RsmB/NOP family class I SAM-dependent RNA methyltransferase [Chlamydiales bacterium]|nr:RsmB/NOP family class I SAM-dependent RNA methyltransferase [Chlamydiales bacterium]